MGCDIHPYVEMKGDDGKWHAVKPAGNDPRWAKPEDIEWDFNRSYHSFSVLAGVRNSDEYRPIAEPRGIPEDASQEVKDESERWDSDGHSHSWLSLSEILAYDWDQKVTNTGIVGESEFKSFMEKGEPESWCGGVGGGNVKHITNSEMKRIVMEGRAEGDEAFYYTELTWETKVKDYCGTLLSFVESLKKLGDPERIRVVFWFDN